MYTALNDVTSARTFFEANVNVQVDGCIPINVGFEVSNYNLEVYTLYIHAVNGAYLVHYGLRTLDGSTFQNVTLRLYVSYIKRYS